MLENTGNYVSTAKFLCELANAGKATALQGILSSVSPTTVEFTSLSSDFPEVGQFLVQGDLSEIILGVSATTLTLGSTSGFISSSAKAISSSFDALELEGFIKDSMNYIDLNTRQFFNARTFTVADGNAIKIEGNNSNVLFLPVPILELTNIYKNEETTPIDPKNLKVYNSRNPISDDRRNPMIKIRQESDFLTFSYGKFARGLFTTIEGRFGYLEPDGSTPRLIQRATLKLALLRANTTLGESANQSAGSAGRGAIKREKTDLHEIEYFEVKTAGDDSSTATTTLSGDSEVDSIIAAFRGPIAITGSFPDVGAEAPAIAHLGDHYNGRYS